MKKLLQDHTLILMEAAIVERLRRKDVALLHPTLANAPLLYDKRGREILEALYQEYIDIAVGAAVPFIMCTPTWRTNHERVFQARERQAINRDAVEFLKRIRDSQQRKSALIKIGGMIGCKNDCYVPEDGLSIDEAMRFHSWQIEELAVAGADFLLAETVPNVDEAIGIAQAMETTGTPYIISFVISREGRVLDGTTLLDAVHRVDAHVHQKPLGFMVNCAYPTFLCADKQPRELFHRLIGYQANASSLDHSVLDGSAQLDAAPIREWGDELLRLHKEYGMKILGGCCGTGPDHLRYIAKKAFP